MSVIFRGGLATLAKSLFGEGVPVRQLNSNEYPRNFASKSGVSQSRHSVEEREARCQKFGRPQKSLATFPWISRYPLPLGKPQAIDWNILGFLKFDLVDLCWECSYKPKVLEIERARLKSLLCAWKDDSGHGETLLLFNKMIGANRLRTGKDPRRISKRNTFNSQHLKFRKDYRSRD